MYTCLPKKRNMANTKNKKKHVLKISSNIQDIAEKIRGAQSSLEKEKLEKKLEVHIQKMDEVQNSYPHLCL